MTIRIAIDIDIFGFLAAQSSDVSSSVIAAATGSDQMLVYRLLRTLSTLGVVHERTRDTWSANAVTKAMAAKPMAAWHRLIWDLNVTSALQAPELLRTVGHQTIQDPTAGFAQYAFGTKLDTFSFLQTMPSLSRDFNEAMGSNMGQPDAWFNWYPVQERLLAGVDREAPTLVDMGGGKGHDIQAFSRAFPDAGGLVLQDIPKVIDSIGQAALDPAITRQKHDFFTGQPVRGAKVYFLRHILHDWPDSDCLRILKEVRSAMQPGYSKLIIHELILPEVGASRAQCEIDLCMMLFNGGVERSQSQWTALLTQAGFEKLKFWQKYSEHDGVIEAAVGSP